MPTPRRCLVLRRGGLGDTLLMVPVLRALARVHPGARIEFAGVREFADVLVAHGVVAAAHSSEDLALWAPARARERLAPFDLVVTDDAAAHDAAPAAVLGFEPRPRDRRPLPLQIAGQLGLAVQLPQDAMLRVVGPTAPSGACVLAPGSGARAKNWPREHWLALAASLPAAVAIAVVVGPTEQERDDPRRWPWPRAVAFFADLTVVQLAQRLAAAATFVGNDSGPTHLAAMLGLRTVALFGGGDAAVFAPLGERVVVVQADGGQLAAITPAQVAQLVSA